MKAYSSPDGSPPAHRSTGGFVDFASSKSHSSPHARKSFSTKVGSLRITLPSVRRSRKVFLLSSAGRMVVYAIGFLFLLWGLHRSSIIIVHKGDGLDMLNALLAVFGGFFLVFLANHDEAVMRKRDSKRCSK